MNEHAKRGVSSDPSLPGAARFHSLLVPIDLTPSSDRVLGRIAHIPLSDNAQVTILHVVPGNIPPRDQRRAERDASEAVAGEVRHLHQLMRKNAHIHSVVKFGGAAREIGACATQVKAELIVMGRGGGRALRDAFLGSTAERVIRQTRLPVLVVRLPPRSAYGRPALALDLDQPAHEIVRLMLRMLPPTHPRVAVIHAYDIPYRGLIYPSLSKEEADETTEEFHRKAAEELAGLLGTALAKVNVPPKGVPSWRTYIRHGSPGRVVEKVMRENGTDLLVLGTRNYSGTAYAFLGTVAGDLLRRTKCDVLVVPPNPSPLR